MTIMMSVKCKMNDYDAFKQAFDATNEAHAQEMGILASTIYRDLDDPDVVTVLHQVPDADAAKATVAQWNSEESKEVFRKAGWAQMDTFEITLLQTAE